MLYVVFDLNDCFKDINEVLVSVAKIHILLKVLYSDFRILLQNDLLARKGKTSCIQIEIYMQQTQLIKYLIKLF